MPFLVGDIVNDLRATLDNLISDLALVFGYPAKSEFSFPITRNATTFDNVMTRFAKFPEAIRDEFRAVQPHDTSGELIPFHLLWMLDKLWNGDKHRSPAIATLILGTTSIRYRDYIIPLDIDVADTEISLARGEFKLVSIDAIEYFDPITKERVIDPDPKIQVHVAHGIRFGEMVPPSPATGGDVWSLINKSNYLVEKIVINIGTILASGG